MKKFPSLKSYFLSEHFGDGRFQRLNEWFSDPSLEPAFLFTQATISIFTNFSLLLQREEPTLHILKLSIERLGRKIANRIVKLNNGDRTQATYDQFDKGVQFYYNDALDYIQRKFSISDPIIGNSRWVDVLQRDKAEWNQVEFFIEKYSNRTFLQNIDNDLLFDEFVDYQSMYDDDISADAWSDEADIIVLMSWRHYIAKIILPGTCSKISQVASLVLVLPHSNAGLEQLFSVVRKSKTDMRSSLKLNRTLSSILTTETYNPESLNLCYKLCDQIKIC